MSGGSDYVAIAERLLADGRREIARADGKAGTLAAGAMAAASVLAQGSAWQRRVAGGPFSAGMLIGGALCWIAGVVMLTTVVYPLTRSRHGGGVPTYFGAVARSPSLGNLASDLAAAAADPQRWLLLQLDEVSRIALVKYRLVRCGVWLLALGGALSVAGWTVS